MCKALRTVLSVILLITGIGAAAMEYQLNASLGEGIEVLPIYDGHEGNMPASLREASQLLPSGSFIIRNHTTRSITIVVTVWSYVDASGAVRTHTLKCDGYVGSPAAEIVKPSASTLVTPNGCVPDEYFAELSNRTRAISTIKPAPTASVIRTLITVDSITFNDGGTRGPDATHYSETVTERFRALADVLAEVRAKQESLAFSRATLQSLRDVSKASRTPHGNFKTDFYNSLLASPNIEGTLRHLRQRPEPPTFHRDEGGMQ